MMQTEILNQSALGFLKAAILTLSEGQEFKTLDEFESWLSANFDTVVETARAMNIKTGSQLLDAENRPAQKVKELMAVSVYAQITHEQTQERARREYNHILKTP